MSDQNDILSPASGSGGRLSEERLQAYLEGRLNPAEQHEVERWLAEEGMEADALEGLQAISPEDAKHTVGRLNLQLKKQLGTGKRRRRSGTGDNKWGVIAIFVVLLLILLAYVVIRMTLVK
ncbi:MAG: hypothetical protein EOP49_05000 [Sphingobacteriales bacterium]|nr:MAG: hypothetical protein EOP49_05000 [Sphingobacteriales bacterium]